MIVGFQSVNNSNPAGAGEAGKPLSNTAEGFVDAVLGKFVVGHSVISAGNNEESRSPSGAKTLIQIRLFQKEMATLLRSFSRLYYLNLQIQSLQQGARISPVAVIPVAVIPVPIIPAAVIPVAIIPVAITGIPPLITWSIIYRPPYWHIDHWWATHFIDHWWATHFIDHWWAMHFIDHWWATHFPVRHRKSPSGGVVGVAMRFSAVAYGESND